MNRRAAHRLLLLLSLACLVRGQTQLLSISSLSPAQTTAGAASFTLTVTGSGFVADGVSRVSWGGTLLPLPSSVTSTRMTVTVDSSLVRTPGAVQVRVVNAGQIFSNIFTFTVNSPPVISPAALPGATVGAPYAQQFSVTGGTGPSYTWSSSGLPAWLFLSADGRLTGEPRAAGTYILTIFVTDTAGVSAQTRYTLTVNPAPLSITTASLLPAATAGASYSQTLAASGGTPPYSWSLTTGSLPPGLALSAAGVLGGTPTQGGNYSFTVRAADAAGVSASRAFSLAVGVPPPPAVSVTGLSETVSPAQQPTFDVQLSSAFSLAITGTVTLTFTPDAVAPADDPSIQFSSGGRTLGFTIPAGQTRAFPASAPAIQTGTVAGRIVLTVRLNAGGQDITPAPAPSRSVQILRSAPQITGVQVVNKTSSGFTVRITGYSTPREVTQATFAFAQAPGGSLGTTSLVVPVASAFTTWFGGTGSGQFGSTFLYTQPFQVQGEIGAIGSVTVTLTNSTGTSPPASAAF